MNKYNKVITDILYSILNMYYNDIELKSKSLNIILNFLKNTDSYKDIFVRNPNEKWRLIENEDCALYYLDNINIRYIYHIFVSFMFKYEEDVDTDEEDDIKLRNLIHKLFSKKYIIKIYNKYYINNTFKYNNYEKEYIKLDKIIYKTEFK